jgi:hypothetical protein
MLDEYSPDRLRGCGVPWLIGGGGDWQAQVRQKMSKEDFIKMNRGINDQAGSLSIYLSIYLYIFLCIYLSIYIYIYIYPSLSHSPPCSSSLHHLSLAPFFPLEVDRGTNDQVHCPVSLDCLAVSIALSLCL